MRRHALLLTVCLLSAACDGGRDEPTLPSQPVAPAPAATPPKSEGTITVEAEALPDEVKAAAAVWFRGKLHDAIAAVANKTAQEFFEKLGPTDAIDHTVLNCIKEFADPAAGEDDGEDDSFSIYLLRPGAGTHSPKTVVLVKEGRPFLTLTRMNSPVERPLAILTRARILKGHPVQDEVYLEHDPVEGWQAVRPKGLPAKVGE